MRPQEPSLPPYRNTGTGGETTRAGRHAGRDDAADHEDPYGDVPAPPASSGSGVQAPYGSSGWSGSDT